MPGIKTEFLTLNVSDGTEMRTYLGAARRG